MHTRLILTVLLILTIPAQVQASTKEFSVAATVKPIHSLVAGVMQGVGEPRLVMGTSASPHHYTLRPSERRTLEQASLIFWVGPELETFMPRILGSLGASSKSVALIKAKGLLPLPARSVHHQAQSHIDPHIWLSPHNAHAMVDAIADELSGLDAAHAHIYDDNRNQMHQRIREIDERIRRKLAGKTSAFISYHDAYQYFEKAYGLNNTGFVSSGDEVSPSAKYVHELRNLIQSRQIHCLFYEAPNRPALVDTLTRGLEVDALELDALGVRLEPGEDTWYKIIDKLAEAYNSCL
ncbi:MAG: zinc ABC transporter substrate-binding protein [Gammaproteobacteria bacterium]|jgi:zinc transport system substrate-binding protein